MQKCKINKLSCFGCDKKTGECYSIENCQHKVVYMDKEEAEEIIKKIKEEEIRNISSSFFYPTRFFLSYISLYLFGFLSSGFS